MTESNERQPIRKVVRNFFLFVSFLDSHSLFWESFWLLLTFYLLGPDSAFEVASRFSLPFGGTCGGVAGFSASVIAGIMTFIAKREEKFKFGWFFAIWFLVTIGLMCGWARLLFPHQ